MGDIALLWSNFPTSMLSRAREMPFEWRFSGGLIVAFFYMLTGFILTCSFYPCFCDIAECMGESFQDYSGIQDFEADFP